MNAAKLGVMTARLARIKAAVQSGKTVHYSVGMRTFVFTAKNIGTLAIKGDSLCVRCGKSWSRIDYYTSITAA
ncbi:MAG: hypothetical protein EBR82_53650 [Caulobacteraceae bacterium]|nr:hypothetical protein [Caulobacteraceae bacterium]